MPKIFILLIKWTPVGVGACFALNFLINSQWIPVVIATIVTLGWVGVMNRIGKCQYSNPLIHEDEKKELIIWESIEIFNTSDREHLSLGDSILELCKKIVFRFGSGEHPEYRYQDDIITIRINDSFKVSLTSTDKVVLETQETQGSGDGYFTITVFEVFHVGTWIDHVNSFKARIDQVYAEEAEKRQQDYLRDRYERFGRID